MYLFSPNGGLEMVMKNVRKHYHFWLIVGVLVTFIVLSAASLAGLDWVVVEDDFTFTYASLVIPVFFLAVVLAVWKYGLKTAMTVCGILGALMLALVLTGTQGSGNLHGTIIVIAVGISAVYWIDRERNNRRRREQDTEEIES